ncbi:MAG: ATP-binding protein [Bacteroidetes bacterium]|nr:ATP-binding protein [Bacteroidota bacterium]
MMVDFSQYPAQDAPPKAGVMINTFRAFGYDLRTAIADIVDNSISAGARNVWIDYNWEGADYFIRIRDDGHGMSLPELIQAMTPGSRDPNEVRDSKDLGRFGLGLKTASFSQCKQLTVITKRRDHGVIHRCWDLDHVNETGNWSLLDYNPDPVSAEALGEHGTIVLWRKLDRLIKSRLESDEAGRAAYFEELEQVHKHLSLVFHRYLERGELALFMGGNKLVPWDPFMKGKPGVQIPVEEALDEGRITVKGYTMPHITNIPAAERSDARTNEWPDLQGFYVYRNDRLLLYGDWLGTGNRSEPTKNARIMVNLPNSLDHEWQIDIKKSTARPPAHIKKHLKRLAMVTRNTSIKIHKFRGNKVLLQHNASSVTYDAIWKALEDRDGNFNYSINEDHPLIQHFMRQDGLKSKDLMYVLRQVAAAVPVEVIIQNHSESAARHELRKPYGELDKQTILLARSIYKELLEAGMSKDMAEKRLLNTQPFSEYPELTSYLDNL